MVSQQVNFVIRIHISERKVCVAVLEVLECTNRRRLSCVKTSIALPFTAHPRVAPSERDRNAMVRMRDLTATHVLTIQQAFKLLRQARALHRLSRSWTHCLARRHTTSSRWHTQRRTSTLAWLGGAMGVGVSSLWFAHYVSAEEQPKVHVAIEHTAHLSCR